MKAFLLLLLLLCAPTAWADETTLTLADGNLCHRPAIAADAHGKVHVVYEGYDKATQVFEIYHARSDDNGRTWGPSVNLSHTPGTSTRPCLCLDKTGAVCVAWIDTTSGEKCPDLFFSRSTDGGQTWSKAIDVSNTPGVSSQPAIAAGPDGSLHLAWVDTSAGETSPDIWYSTSSDRGLTWSPGINLSNTPGVSGSPAIAVGTDGTVHVVWVDTTSGDDKPDVYYTSGKNRQFGQAIDVSNTPGISSQPHVAAGGGYVYVAWIDTTLKKEAPDVFMVRKSGDQPFSVPQDISNTPGVSSDPAIAADPSGQVAVAWIDNYQARKPDVYLAASQDFGQTFAAPLNISKAREHTRLPDIKFAGQSMVAVWEELVDGIAVVKMTTVVQGAKP